MKAKIFYTFGVGFFFGIGWGWVLNIITLYHSDFSHLTGKLVLRACGVILIPLGGVLGFL